MKLTAKLVEFSFLIRVVVPEDATDEQILAQATVDLSQRTTYEAGENLVGIEDDEECPIEGQGESWDVFDTGSAGHPKLQIQRIGEVFESDGEAQRFVRYQGIDVGPSGELSFCS